MAPLFGVTLALFVGRAEAVDVAPVPAVNPEAPAVVAEVPHEPADANQLEPLNRRLATVGATEVTQGDLIRFVRRQPLKGDLLGTPEGQATVLRELIENRLVNQAARAAAELPADASPSDMEKAVRDLERAQWPPIEPSEEQVRSYYEAHRAEFGIPAAVRIRDIFFPLPEDADAQAKAAVRARAEQVLATARAGEPFEQLAQEHAHTEALQLMGGDQKFLPLYRYPYLDAATAGMDEGELSDIIELPDGLQIFQYLGRREAIPASYEVAAIEIRAMLAEASRTEPARRFIRAYGNQVGVRILDPRFSAAWPDTSTPTQSP
jgi:hypothetical protein